MFLPPSFLKLRFVYTQKSQERKQDEIKRATHHCVYLLNRPPSPQSAFTVSYQLTCSINCL